MHTSISASETATLHSGNGQLYSCNLCAGGDAATAIFRSGGASGTIITKLACAANTSVGRTFVAGVVYSDLHVTLTGTAPVVDVEI